MLEPKFKKGDYIINRKGRIMGIVSKLDSKGYYNFKFLYGGMFNTVFDTNIELVQINYQKFFDFCTDEEKEKLDEIIKEHKKTKAKKNATKQDKADKGKGK